MFEKFSSLRLATVLAAVLLTVTACDNVGGVTRKVAAVNAETEAQAVQRYREVRVPRNAEQVGTVKVRDAVWLGHGSIRSEHGDPLPFVLQQPAGVTLISPTKLTLAEVAAEISSLSGLAVRIDLDDEKESGAQTTTSSTSGSNTQDEFTQQADSLSETADLASTLASSGLLDAPAARDLLRRETEGEAHEIEWQGPLSGLLDFVSAKFNVSWEYKEGVVRLYRFQVRTFTLYAMPGSSDFSSGVGGLASATSGSGSGDSFEAGEQQTNVSARIEIWREVEETIDTILPEGGKASFSQATGTITVRAPPTAMRLIGEYIEETNRRLLRQIAFTIRVLSVTVNEEENFGIDFSTIFQEMSQEFSIQFMGAPSGVAAANAAQLSFGILGAPNNPSLGQFNGSQALITALANYGKVSTVTSAAAVTLNNQPVPLQVGQETSFLESVSVTQGDGIATTSLEPGKVTTGFGLTLLPRILEDGRLLVQFSLNLSELNGPLKTFTSGAGANSESITVPDINRRSFLQQVMLRSGDTLVLSGFEQARNSTDNQGTGTADTWWLGGRRHGTVAREMVVILLTPTVLQPLGNDWVTAAN